MLVLLTVFTGGFGDWFAPLLIGAPDVALGSTYLRKEVIKWQPKTAIYGENPTEKPCEPRCDIAGSALDGAPCTVPNAFRRKKHGEIWVVWVMCSVHVPRWSRRQATHFSYTVRMIPQRSPTNTPMREDPAREAERGMREEKEGRVVEVADIRGIGEPQRTGVNVSKDNNCSKVSACSCSPFTHQSSQSYSRNNAADNDGDGPARATV